ncbi:hypothetical protein BpHYR1_037336 [Brachionus plicatilis]|uniref:Uncharacterized protein n=1 Tax=Brachionus plicatilis TaxID=10195 RepID=A0A3M7R0P1_BRAPC|nr:hypothetical protein BpHYR1_037336 [Brachionus plicatilis]
MYIRSQVIIAQLIIVLVSISYKGTCSDETLKFDPFELFDLMKIEYLQKKFRSQEIQCLSFLKSFLNAYDQKNEGCEVHFNSIISIQKNFNNFSCLISITNIDGRNRYFQN